jgi:hypothetical protein
MMTPERIALHQSIQRAHPNWTPEQVEEYILRDFKQNHELDWLGGFAMLFLMALVIFVGVLLK